MDLTGINNGNGHVHRQLNLSDGHLLGSVQCIDANRFEVEVEDPGFATRVTVSDLVAFPTQDGFLIGLVDRVVQRRPENRPEAGRDGRRRGVPVDLSIMPLGTLHGPQGGRTSGFTRGTSSFPHIGDPCHLMEGDALHWFLSVLGEGIAPGERLVLGRFAADEEATAVADGNRLFQRHVALLGSTGTGKSWAVAHVVERAARLPHANMIIFDLHGEYGRLTENEIGSDPMARALRVAGPADLGDVADDVLYLPYWLLRKDELLTLVLNDDDPHAADQVLRFGDHLQTLKQVSLIESGRDSAIKTFTVDSPIPFKLNHLVNGLKSDDTEKIVMHPNNRVEPGPYAGRLTGLINRLEARAVDPRYGFIFAPPAETLRYEWLTEMAAKLLGDGNGASGIKVVDLSEVPSTILPIVAGVLARLVYNVQFWMDPARRTPISLVCDEAHLYLPPREESGPVHHAALETFESIAKEGRKYGVGLFVVSQRPSDVSRTILSQCNNFIVMRLTNDHDRGMVERLIPDSLSSLTSVLPALDVGEAVVIGDALLLPTRVKFDPPSAHPSSATQPYWTIWRERSPEPDAIAAGVEALRNQLRTSDEPHPV